nr:2-C-methyl-D-erythritol 2,4-cyclodiphosphate synthase [Anaerofilum hominis]
MNGKKVTAVIVAAGASRRMGFDKLFYELQGKPVLAHTLDAFEGHPLVDAIVLVAGENEARVRALAQGRPKVEAVVRGGATRVASVRAGLAAAGRQGLVAIQDGARPFVSEALVTRALEAGARWGAAAPAVPVKDTIKVVDAEKFVRGTPRRDSLMAVQTPQVFDAFLYSEALAACADDTATDDCGVFEAFGGRVKLVEGDYANLKITTREDLAPYEGKERTAVRIGHGYDVHRLTDGRKLILGGVEISWEKGLLGHSDADVLVHAVMDALLGAAALGDIGRHFPDSDPAYAGADSLALLRRVAGLLREAGWEPENIDATVLCQAPRLAPHIPEMRRRISAAAGLPEAAVSIKATTEEGLGFTGAGEGVAAHAVCLLREAD